MRQQRTISRSVEIAGFGYWSGRDVRVQFRPAEPDVGIVFVRGDLKPAVRIPAQVQNRIEVPRRTTLRAGGVGVDMVEHIMAALAGLGIDNCEVWANEPEMPGCDGSSLPFVEVLEDAGIETQDAPRMQLAIREVTRLGDEDCWILASPTAPDAGLSIRYRLDYGPGNGIGRQTIDLCVTPEAFRTELAPSRTFVLKEEAQWLREQGLGTRAQFSDLLVFDNGGPIDNELRYHDECVRHKALDLIGDLALLGCDLVGRVVAHRSGHRLNAALVRALLAEGEMIGECRRSA